MTCCWTPTTRTLAPRTDRGSSILAHDHQGPAQSRSRRRLSTNGQPAGSKNRRALVIAGDDPSAKATVTDLLDRFGFDTVDAGPLKEGWRIQRDTPGYGPRRTAEELRRDLAAARRYADQ